MSVIGSAQPDVVRIKVYVRNYLFLLLSCITCYLL
jgi:hypothetical protein